MTRGKTRRNIPPRVISHCNCIQSGVVDWGGGGAVGEGNSGVGGGDSVVKAPMALQSLWLSLLIALIFQ